MSQYNSKPITQLIPGTAVLATDVYPAVDTTDLTQSSSGTTKKYTIGQFQEFIINSFTGSNKETVRVATTGNLTANYDNGPDDDGIGATLVNSGALSALTVDGQALIAGDRILVSMQTTSYQNGIYVVSDAGDVGAPWVLTRASDFDGSALGEIVQGDFVGVLFGNLYGLTFWFVTSSTPAQIGVDPITFQKQVEPTGNAWVNQTTGSVTLAINTGYTSAAGVTAITYSLPALSSVGDWIEITGKDSGLYTIAQLAGQQIFVDPLATTIGIAGSISSLTDKSNIRLICIEANLYWTAVSSVGSFSVI